MILQNTASQTQIHPLLSNKHPVSHIIVLHHNKSAIQSKENAAFQHNISPRSNRNKSYIAQGNHRDPAAQTRNRNGRVALGRAAVANLHTRTKHLVSHKKHVSPFCITQKHPSNKRNKSITWPYALPPQQDTAPPIDSAHECNCKTQRHKHPFVSSSQLNIPRHTSSCFNITRAQSNQKKTLCSNTTYRPEAIATNLTPPKAIIATPLPKPETETGVLRWVKLPSPT
jgi:hypothetical protein